MERKTQFSTFRRQEFRRYFQPSRILLGVIPASTESGVNIITLCFSMHCSYKPPMMAIAIQNVAVSYELIQKASEYVLAVPGESMARETMYCGVTSMSKVDKVKELGLELCASGKIAVPGLSKAIANVEMVKESVIKIGDHVLVVGRVARFGVNKLADELPLLSVGPDTRGFRVLAEGGIHRIAVVATLGVNSAA
jgi:flavin reductase (DIM6/NTAB) family NADH-FMN oxidoreductase RutF